MAEKLVVGPIDKGLRTDRLPFAIDNDSFPFLLNAYQWRGRVKRKRGTSPLGRLSRYLTYTNYNSLNLLTGLESTATLIPGSINVKGAGGTTWTDPGMDGVLVPSVGVNGTVNYITGILTGPTAPLMTATFGYYPGLPVLGLEDLTLTDSQFATNLSFDTTYSYNISSMFPYPIYDVSFYKNPPTNTYTNYVQKKQLLRGMDKIINNSGL
jgi:hypothetical protein